MTTHNLFLKDKYCRFCLCGVILLQTNIYSFFLFFTIIIIITVTIIVSWNKNIINFKKGSVTIRIIMNHDALSVLIMTNSNFRSVKNFWKFIHVHPMQMEKHNINQCFIETYFDK